MSTISNLVRGGVVVAGIGALAFAGGCRSKQEKAYGTPRGGEQANPTPGAPGAAGQGTQSPAATAISDITEARCAHAAKCQEIGQGKKYDTQDHCSATVKTQVGHQVNATQCPTGVDASLLNACLDAIKNASCGADLTNEKACDSATLCPGAQQPGQQGTGQQPGMQEPGMQQGAGQQGVQHPGTQQPGAGQQGVGQPGTQPHGTQPGAGTHGTQPGMGQPGTTNR